MSRSPPSPLALLREAGCACTRPRIATKPGVGPRCAKCGTQVVMVKRGVTG